MQLQELKSRILKNDRLGKIVTISIVTILLLGFWSFIIDGEGRWLSNISEFSSYTDFPFLDDQVQFTFITIDKTVLIEDEYATINYGLRSHLDTDSSVTIITKIIDSNSGYLDIILPTGFTKEMIQQIDINSNQKMKGEIKILGSCNGCRNDSGFQIILLDESGNELQSQYFRISIYTPFYYFWK